MFIGREQELKFLEEKYTQNGGQLVVLYGRRRVGKTETLRQFCKGKQHIFFSRGECTDKLQLTIINEKGTTIYEASANPIKKYYLPRLGIYKKSNGQIVYKDITTISKEIVNPEHFIYRVIHELLLLGLILPSILPSFLR